MQDAELCKELLQRILPELDIAHVEYPELQKTITVYDIEMQAVTSKYLPRRTRYCQSMIDMQLMNKGQNTGTG